MSGKPGRSGRKSKPKADSQWAHDKKIEAQLALRRIINWAKDETNKAKDPRAWIEANKYVYEVEHGRPHQAMDMRLKAAIFTTGDDYALALLADEAAERKLIEEHNATEQGTNEATQES